MIIILCVDDNMGMLFNSRRQSRDRTVIERILSLSDGGKLWVSAYSSKLFGGGDFPQVITDDDFPIKAEDGEYCFVEDIDIAVCEGRIEKIILYHWNRVYPADTYFNIPLQENEWRRIGCSDFSGYSHDKITEEIYVR